MADVTFYFPSSGAADHACAVDAIWDDTDDLARLTMPTTRGSSAGAAGGGYKSNGKYYNVNRQYVSSPLAAREWATADTFDISLAWRDTGAVGFSMYLVIRVFNAAGDTVVGTLYTGRPNTNAFHTSWRTIHADGVPVQNNVSMPENGHVVVEVGFYDAAHLAGTVSYLHGENLSNAAPLNDTDTSGDVWPWLAFTYGASGISVPLTGVSGTASVGAVALSLAMALSAVVGTGAVGTLGPDVTVPISGVEAPASVGTMSPNMAAIAAGIEALGETGTIGQGVTVFLTGTTATGEVGAAAPGTDLPLTDNVATGTVGTLNWNGSCSVGDVAPSGTVPLTGAAGTGEVGTVVGEIGVGPDITIPITGVSANPAYQLSGVLATGGVGTITPVEATDIVLPLTGISGVGSVGTVVYFAGGGEAATGEIGSVAPNVSPPITGNEATAAVGDVGQDRTAGITGTSANGVAGGWNNTARPLTGNEAMGEVGTLVPRIAPAITGIPATAGVGSVTQAHSVALPGVAGTGVAGHVDHFVAGDIVLPLTGIVVTTSIGTLTCRTAVPTYIHVTPRKRIIDVAPRKRIIDVFRRRS